MENKVLLERELNDYTYEVDTLVREYYTDKKFDKI